MVRASAGAGPWLSGPGRLVRPGMADPAAPGAWRAPDERRITTARTLLTPITVADAEEMAGVLGDAVLYAFIGGDPPDAAGLRSRYQRFVRGRSDDGLQDWFNWVIRRAEDARAVGTVQATVTAGGRQAEIAWIVGLPWQGRGYASEAAQALVGWLASGGISLIIAHVHPGHGASETVARRAGLAPTGEIHDGERQWVCRRPTGEPP